MAAPFGPGEREGTEERGDAAGEEEERGDTRPRRGVAREAGGSRRWPGHRQRSPPSSFGVRGRKTTERRRWAGPLEELGQVSGRQVSPSALFLILLFCFIFI